jgi:hypothetical protein
LDKDFADTDFRLVDRNTGMLIFFLDAKTFFLDDKKGGRYPPKGAEKGR